MGFAQPDSATMLMAQSCGTFDRESRRVFPPHGGKHAQWRARHRSRWRPRLAERRSAPSVPPEARPGRGPEIRRRPPRTSRHRPGAGRRFRAEGAAQPRRTAPQVHRYRDRLHNFARSGRRRRDGRRGAILQGPDPRRADRGARAPARSPRRGRRDGGGDGARDQEPAGRHRSAGGAAPPQGARQRRCAGARQGHHQRSQDG